MKRFLRAAFLFVVYPLFFFNDLQAQTIANYTYSTSTTGSLTDMSSGTTDLLSTTGSYQDDVASSVVMMGFTVYFMGTAYDRFSINSNGQMKLGNANDLTAIIGTNVSSPASNTAYLTPLTGDNGIQTTGKVHYKVTGTTLVVEWKGLRIPHTSGGAGTASLMQASIDGATGVVSYTYGTMFENDSGTSTRSVALSSSNISTTSTYIATITGTPTNTNSSTWSTTTFAAASNMTNLHGAADGSRRVFTYTPVQSTSPAAPITMTFTSVAATTQTINWVDNSTTETFFIVRRSTAMGGPFTQIGTVNSTTVGGMGTGYLFNDTGLSPSTTYYYEVAAANEASAPSSALTGNNSTIAGTTYTWNQAGGGVFTTAANWTPTRTTPAATDVLVFDGAISAGITSVSLQTISQLKLQNNATPNLSGSTLTISGAAGTDLDVPSGSTLTLTTSSIAFSATSPTADISGTLNVGSSGTYTATNSTTTVSGTMGNAGTITSTTSNLAFSSTGIYNHNYTTTAGTIPTATWNSGSTCQITGYTSNSSITSGITSSSNTFANLIWDCSSQTANISLGGSTINVNGTFTMRRTNTGSFRLGASSGGILNCANFVQDMAGTLDLSSGAGSGTINATGTFTRTAGTLTETGSGTTNRISFNGTLAQSPTIGTLTNSVGVRINNAAGVSVGTLTINDGATLSMVQGALTGTITYTNTTATGAILSYEGTSAQTTTDAEFPAASGPGSLTINNATGVVLHASRTVNPPVASNIALTLTAGVLTLGNFDLTIGANGTISVSSPSATKMVLTSGTGQLKKTFGTGASSAFTFPIGENTGTTEYSPLALTFSANSISRTIGVKVVDADPPSNGGSTTFISRYWPVTNDAAGTFTYGGTMTFLASGDINGTVSNLLVQYYNGTSYVDVASSVSSPTLTITAGVTNSTTPFDNTGNTVLTGRRSPPESYIWNGSTSGDWGTTSNWTPAGIPGSIDDVTINVPGTTPLTITSARSVANFNLSGTGTFTLNASTTLTIITAFSFDNSGGASANLNCTSTVDFASSGAVSIPALNFGNLTNTGNGARTLPSTGTVGICTAFTPGSGAYTTTGSTVDFTGTGSQTINAFSFFNLSNSGNGARNINNAINVAGMYTPTTGTITASSGTMTFNGTSAQTIPASNYFNLTTTGSQAITLASSGNIDIAGAFTPGGTNTFTTTGSTIRFTGILGTHVFPVFSYNNVTFRSSGSGTFTMPIGATITVGGDMTIQTSSTSSTVIVAGTSTASNAILNVSGNLVINTGGRLNLQGHSGTGTATVNVTGNVTIDGSSTGTGTPYIYLESVSSTSGSGVLVINGNFTESCSAGATIANFGTGSSLAGNRIEFKGNFSKTGSTSSFYTSGSPTGANVPTGLVFSKSGIQTLSYAGTGSGYTQWVIENGSTTTMSSGLALSTATGNPLQTFAIKAGGILDMGVNVISGGGTDATFALLAGGTIKTANATGLTGAITATFATKTYSSLANYEFQGAATGTFTTTPTAKTANNLTFSRTGGGAVTMSQDMTATGSLKISTNTVVSSTLANFLGLGSTTAGTILNDNGSTPTGIADYTGGYVDGFFKRGVPAATTSGQEGILPVGTSTTVRLMSVEFTAAPSAHTLTANFNNADPTATGLPVTTQGITAVGASPTGFWTVSASSVQSAAYTATVDASGFTQSDGISLISNLPGIKLGKRSSGTYSTTETTGTNTALSSVSASNFSGFSDFAIIGTGAALALPIELTSFTGKATATTNTLAWETATEQNVHEFVIERSADGKSNWASIGRQAAAGKSTVPQSYKMQDFAPLAVAYYRLRSVDNDGSFQLSNIVAIFRQRDLFGISAAFPVPTTDDVNIQYESLEETDINLRVVDIAGRIVSEQTCVASKGINTCVVSLSELTAGTYFVVIDNGQFVSAPARVVKQ